MMTQGVVLISRDRPRLQAGVRASAEVVFGSLLIALCARIAVPLYWTPVPLTLSTFGVLLMAAFLGPQKGTAAVALYLMEGGCGLPVFAGGGGGWAALLGPTGGYLAGFLPAAAVVGLLCGGKNRGFVASFLAMAAGTALIWIAGLAWLAHWFSPRALLAAGLYPFIAFDLVKGALAAACLHFSGRNNRG